MRSTNGLSEGWVAAHPVLGLAPRTLVGQAWRQVPLSHGEAVISAGERGGTGGRQGGVTGSWSPSPAAGVLPVAGSACQSHRLLLVCHLGTRTWPPRSLAGLRCLPVPGSGCPSAPGGVGKPHSGSSALR